MQETTAAPHASPMTLADVAPELREAIRKMPRIPYWNPFVRWLVRVTLPLLARPRRYEGLAVHKVAIPNGRHARLYLPERRRSKAALLWIHGGGMVIGHPLQDDARCAEIACELGIVVLSADYRLAPNSHFPAALDDCRAAWGWIVESAHRYGVDGAMLAIGGQSAGGGLAAALVQRIHNEGGVQPVAQWLYCPMLDDRTAANRDLDSIRHFVWDNEQNRFGWRAYLGVEPGSTSLPACSVPARRTDLSGLPPAWIGCGDIELFTDENRAYAERLLAAGVACHLEVIPGAPHGFESIAGGTPMAIAYRTRAREWLAAQLVVA